MSKKQKSQQVESPWFDGQNRLKGSIADIQDQNVLEYLDQAVQAYKRVQDPSLGFFAKRKNKKFYETFQKYYSTLFDEAINTGWDPSKLEINQTIETPSYDNQDYDQSKLGTAENFKFSREFKQPIKKKPNNSREGVIGPEVGITVNRQQAILSNLLGTSDPEAQQRRMKAVMNSKFSTLDQNLRKGRTRFTESDTDYIDPAYFIDWYNKYLRESVGKPTFNKLDGFMTQRDFSGFTRGVKFYGNGRAAVDPGIYGNGYMVDSDKIGNYKQGGMIRKYQEGGMNESPYSGVNNQAPLSDEEMRDQQELSQFVQRYKEDDNFKKQVDQIYAKVESQIDPKVLSQLKGQLGENVKPYVVYSVQKQQQKQKSSMYRNGSKFQCPGGYTINRFKKGGRCLKCERGKKITELQEIISQACGGKTKKRVSKKYDGGVFDWLMNLFANKPKKQSWNTTPPEITYTDEPAVEETTDTKNGVKRFTSNRDSDWGANPNIFFENYAGQDGSWGSVSWPQGQGKGKRRIVQESAPGKLDSLSYRYFGRPLPEQ